MRGLVSRIQQEVTLSCLRYPVLIVFSEYLLYLARRRVTCLSESYPTPTVRSVSLPWLQVPNDPCPPTRSGALCPPPHSSPHGPTLSVDPLGKRHQGGRNRRLVQFSKIFSGERREGLNIVADVPEENGDGLRFERWETTGSERTTSRDQG